ncbi:MAG: HD domain-containing protein [Leptolyngbyaceae bacterium]|nr:HD domain-containing protein [Leptolyngbyaceae bacterium]
MIFSSTGFILKATQFAAQKHQNQRRKGASAAPYINHPVDLAYLLSNRAGVQDEVVLVAALLHDTVEDTETTFEEIEREFGQAVREVVEEVTDDKTLPKEERKQRQIDHAPHLSDRARLVKLADKISNLKDILSAPPDGWSIERQRNYFQWAKQVVDPIRGSDATLEQIFDDVYERGMNRLQAS